MPITEDVSRSLSRWTFWTVGEVSHEGMMNLLLLLLLFNDNYTETNSLFLVGFSNEWGGYSGSILTGDSHSSDEWWSGTWGNVTATIIEQKHWELLWPGTTGSFPCFRKYILTTRRLLSLNCTVVDTLIRSATDTAPTTNAPLYLFQTIPLVLEDDNANCTHSG